jgi:hypothetical protein
MIKPVEAKEKMIWRLVGVVLVPALIAVFGIMRAGMRRKESARYRQTIKHSSGPVG